MMEARRIVVLGVPLLVSLLVLGGCAVAPRMAIPPDLPNTTRDQFLTFRWALVREGGKVHAVGVAESTAGGRWDATVALEGLDGQGRVVSRGSASVRPGFGSGPTPFEAVLVPEGRETEFRLRLVSAEQFSRPGR